VGIESRGFILVRLDTDWRGLANWYGNQVLVPELTIQCNLEYGARM
jgi:hypothetical protein